MGWLENYARSVTNPSSVIPNMLTVGGYSAWEAGQDKDQPSGYQTPTAAASSAARQADIEAGYKRGRDLFYNDPDMQAIRDRRFDLAQGYNGQQLGALREQSRSDLEGQRSKYLQQLQGNLGKGGVGGARAAAMVNQANSGFAANRAANERAINIDQAKQIRQGTSDLQDFLMRQKLGEVGTGIGYGELGVADRTAETQSAIANKEPKRGFLGSLLGNLF